MLLNARHKFSSKNKIYYQNKKKLIFREIQSIKNTDNFEKKNCIICDQSNFEIINEVDRYGFYYPTGICKNCGMIQQSKYYNESYLQKFYSHFYNLFYSHFKNPKERFISQFNGAIKSYHFIEEYLINNKIKILEIGCGAGGILKYYKNLGFDVTGLDYDEAQLEFGISKGLKLKSLNKINFVNEKFDVIILSHVLEHMAFPDREIKNIKKLLTDNGILYIEVPSIHSIKNLNYNFNIRNYFHIAHFLHFSKSSFKNFMKKNNLNILKMNDEIQCVVSKNQINEKFDYISSYEKDLKEIKYIETYYNINKKILFIKKFISRSKYIFFSLIKSLLPKIIIQYLKYFIKK